MLLAGAEKISVNSAAVKNPDIISQGAAAFGSQCVVVGIDSHEQDGAYRVYQNTGDPARTRESGRDTAAWVREVQDRGAGEIVLNCMNQDGVKRGYDLVQLKKLRALLTIPLVASGGAGEPVHFRDVFRDAAAHLRGAAGRP